MAEDLFSSPTPFTPPTTEEDRLAWLRLIRSHRVGVSTFFRLMAEYGSAQAALDALPGIARAAGVARYRPADRASAEAEIAAGERSGAFLLCHGEAEYPDALAGISDPPPVLWCIGDPALLARPMVAMVGARNASSLGTRMARSLAAGLGEAGFTIVSGLARGVDAAAHHGALATGTVAVQAGGVEVTYPRENAALAEAIAEKGLRLSEQPMGLAPQARHFPRRNRIVSGLAHAVIVVEAASRSGSLITAHDALDQGREVLAVPGHPFDARAAGTNALIRDGATLVRGTADVVAALKGSATEPGRDMPAAPGERRLRDMRHHGPDDAAAPPHAATPDTAATGPAPDPATAPRASAARGSRPLRETAALHREILSRLSPSPMAEDQLIRDLALPAAQLSPELLTLELEGRIARQPGGLLARLG